MTTVEGVAPVESAAADVAPGEKGLKQNALGFVSSCVIGVASTAPGYSLAATLGFVALAVGVSAPAVLWVAFIPMLLIAVAYYFMNRAIRTAARRSRG
jgi:hypothetical protein